MGKIYTKTGDSGETSFYGGRRVLKSDPRLCVYGQLDELNTILGMARAWNTHKELETLFKSLQEDLFIVGSDIAAPDHAKIERVNEKMVERLEQEMDKLEPNISELHHFILPSGTKTATILQFARSVCRRAERSLVEFHSKQKVNPQLLIYINRLSDLLFVLARYANKLDSKAEESWQG